MAFTPISNTVPQYEENGIAASGFFIKFYESGTTTPLAMATDSTGGTLLDKCELNTEGYPKNGSGAVFIPHVGQKYKVALFRNAADADNNNLGNAVWDVDALFPVTTESQISGVGPELTSVPLNSDIRVDTVALLRLQEPTVNLQSLLLNGHTDAGIGGDEFYFDESDTTSSDNNGTIIVTTGGKRWKRIFESYVTPEMFGATFGSDDTASFQSALDSFPLVVLSPGIYNISQIFPNNNNTISTPSMSHTTSGGETSTILRYIPGSLSSGQAVIDCKGKTNVNLSGFMLDGVNRSEGHYGIEPTDLSMIISFMQITEFARGISSGNNYLSTSDVIGVKITRCATGIRGAKDTRFTHVHTIACDDFGWNMGAGANDNQIVACKADFCGVNMNFFESSNNTLTSLVIDRANTVGIRIADGTGNSLNGIMFRRNGRNGESDPFENCHLKIEASAEDVTVTGCATRTGDDDGGGGNNTPLTSVSLGTCTNVRFTGNDLAGSTGDNLEDSGTQTNVKFVNNSPEEINTLVVQKGMAYANELPTGTIATGGGVKSISFDNNVLPTSNRQGQTLRISGRDTGGGNFQATIPFMLRREGGSVTSVVGNIVNEINTIVGVTVLIDIINVATDGSSFDVEITNNEPLNIKGSINIF